MYYMTSQDIEIEIVPPTSYEDILGAFQGDEWLSRSEIAKRVKRKVNSRLISLIENMAAHNILRKKIRRLPNGIEGFVYQVIR